MQYLQHRWVSGLLASGALALVAPYHLLAQNAVTNDPAAPINGWALKAGAKPSPRFPAMGARPSTAADFRRSSRFVIRALAREARPSQLLLTDYLPPVAQQGHQGSCVGWSTAYYCYSYSVARQRKLTPAARLKPEFQFSPAFLYHLGNGGKDQGMGLATAFHLLQQKGCSTLAEMPYDEKDFQTPPSTAATAKADRYHARLIASLFQGNPYKQPAPDLELLKTFLAEVKEPFVMAIPIYKDFPNDKVPPEFVYHLTVDPKPENLAGYHAITIIGYDDEKKAFRMVNSWGERWGDGGFLWLAEDFVRDYGTDGWALVPGGPVARMNPREPGPEWPLQETKNAGVLGWTPHITVDPPAASRFPIR